MIDEWIGFVLESARHSSETTEESLSQAVAAYLIAAKEIDRYQALQAQAKLLISEIFLETGQTSAVTPSGNVTTSKASVTVTYDAKSLDILLSDDPALNSRLSPYRKVTERPGTLRITGVK